MVLPRITTSKPWYYHYHTTFRLPLVTSYGESRSPAAAQVDMRCQHYNHPYLAKQDFADTVVMYCTVCHIAPSLAPPPLREHARMLRCGCARARDVVLRVLVPWYYHGLPRITMVIPLSPVVMVSAW